VIFSLNKYLNIFNTKFKNIIILFYSDLSENNLVSIPKQLKDLKNLEYM